MKNLKVSSKMKTSIEKIEKKYGKLTKSFGTETHECNIENKNYYCYCDLSCSILRSLRFTVSFDGTIS